MRTLSQKKGFNFVLGPLTAFFLEEFDPFGRGGGKGLDLFFNGGSGGTGGATDFFAGKGICGGGGGGGFGGVSLSRIPVEQEESVCMVKFIVLVSSEPVP